MQNGKHEEAIHFGGTHASGPGQHRERKKNSVDALEKESQKCLANTQTNFHGRDGPLPQNQPKPQKPPPKNTTGRRKLKREGGGSWERKKIPTWGVSAGRRFKANVSRNQVTATKGNHRGIVKAAKATK